MARCSADTNGRNKTGDSSRTCWSRGILVYLVGLHRLEWLDPLTCLATYDLAVTTPDDEWEGHFASVARYLEGWRVVVSSIPG